ncbi:MAG: galactose oxidase-like domain-containing protein, partial [Pyrinomonadaceae bacterium]
MRTGKVLVIAGSGNVPNVTVYKAAVWNPETGVIADQDIDWDLFCNGMSFLPDGRAIIVGGSAPYPTNDFKGLKNTTIFDPETSIFHRAEDMTDGRWYPTNVSLPDGRTATFSGYGENGTRNATAEIYTPGSGWSPEYANGWPASLGNYPRAHLTPHGDLFFSGAQLNSHRFDPIALTWNQNVARTTHGATRRYGSSVLLGLRPPLYTARILIAGGGAIAATDSTEIIDLGVSTPQWQPTGSLHYARTEHNAVLLPNGRILAIGGSAIDNHIDDNGGGRFSEMYDPATGDWSIMAQQLYWRLYHSTALLLPDGRVASLGSNPQQGTYERHIEIYSPPYLFADNGDLANRPNLTNVPAQIDYTQSFKVTTNTPGAIKEAVLMRPGASTHAFDMEQRLIELEIVSTSDSTLNLIGPPNANIAPPGYYMLFLFNSAGVPSVARFVQLVSNPSNTPPPSPQAPSSPPPPAALLPLSPPSPPEVAPQCSANA